MKRFQTIAVSAAVAAGLVALTACGDNSSNGDGQPAEAETEVVIGYQSGNTVNLLMARENLDERFEEEGYEVVWQELPLGIAVLEALNTGNIDFGHASDANAVFSAAGGQPVEYVASETPYPSGVALISRADSGIEEVADLEGQRVGVTEGGNMHYLMLRALEEQGLSSDDVDVVYYTDASDGMSAFQQGEFDVFGTWDPYLAIIEAQIETNTVVDATGLADNRTFYFATDEFIEEQPEVLEIILDELHESNLWANDNPNEAAGILADALGLDNEPLEVAHNRREFGALVMDDEAVEEQQRLADTFHEEGLFDEEITISDHVDPNPNWIPDNVWNNTN